MHSFQVIARRRSGSGGEKEEEGVFPRPRSPVLLPTLSKIGAERDRFCKLAKFRGISQYGDYSWYSYSDSFFDNIFSLTRSLIFCNFITKLC